MLQVLVNGLALGAAYALLALGFVLVVNATGAVNFAHGELVMAGGLLAVALASLWPVPGFALLPLLMIGMAVIGVLIALAAYFPLKDRPHVSVFISTIAVGIMLQNAANAVFGPEPRTGPALLGGGLLELGPVVLSVQALAVITVAAILVAAQHALFQRTRVGRRLRATAQDRETAEALGINVNGVIAGTFALAAAHAGAAGLLLSNTFFVTPVDGNNYILKAYIAVVIGGWGSIPGALAGAMLIALFEVVWPSLPLLIPPLAGLSGVFSQTTAAILVYVAVLFILVVRPQGLFGEAIQRRA